MTKYFESLNIYKRAIWLYLALLIFEGALRKWFLQPLATPLLLVRDPIVIWLVGVGIVDGWLNSSVVKVTMWVSTLSLLLSLLLCHGNLFVGIYGWRIYFFYIPFIFVMARVLDRDDVVMMGRLLIYLSIPMTALATLQFYSSQSAWVNIGVGGEGSAGFDGAGGYFRPPATFSFTSGYVLFQSVVGCFISFFIFANHTLRRELRIERMVLLLALGCYIVSVPISISRTHLYQSIVLLAFVASAAVAKRRYRGRFVRFSLMGAVVILLIVAGGFVEEGFDAFATRLEAANAIEGGVEGAIGGRYIGGLFGSLLNFDIPPLGFGIGIATNAGARIAGADMYTYFNGEIEWSRIVGECGLIVGWSIILIRLLIAGRLLLYAWQQMVARRENLLPWFLAASMVLSLPQGQMGVSTNLGFAIFSAGITFAALKGDSHNYHTPQQL
ncbi:MAG: hypothetical protein R3Y68_05000 [Rikenellaceae bacterium]